MGRFIPTGCESVDKILRGGLPIGSISLAYGEAASGRTSLAFQCAVNCAKSLGNVIFILAGHAADVERLSRMVKFERGADKKIVLFFPRSFKEQQHIVNRLDKYITKKVKLVVFDTVTELYNAELDSMKRTISLNRELNRQLAHLTEISKKHDLSVLLTAQVHSIPEKEGKVEPVANRILRCWCDVILKLERGPASGVRRAVLEKFLGKKSSRNCYFKMTDQGIQSL